MNTVLINNVLLYLLMIVGLTIVPLLPGLVMRRFLSDGLAADQEERGSARS